VLELVTFLDAHAKRLTEHPGADVVSLLVQSEVEDRKLTPEELVTFNMSLLVAGNETTRHLISGSMLAFADHPDQWTRLRAERDAIPGAVEECLRWVTPIQQFARTVVADTDVNGTPVLADDYLVMLYASGNRDDAAFGSTAAEFDAFRPVAVPNLAFGFGEHLCLGAALARLEARVVFEELLDRYESFEIAGVAEWLPSSLVRGPHSVPIRFP
jgi:cytochrome P450